MITHYGLYREHVPNSPGIKEAHFFEEQKRTSNPEETWWKAWEPIEDAKSIGDARRKFAAMKGVTLSHIYLGEQ